MNTREAKHLFFNTESVRVYQDDFLSARYAKTDSVDLIVTSPPYNVDIQYRSYKDGLTYNQYLAFSEQWMRKAYRMAKPDGRMCLNIPLDKNKGGQQSVCADLTTIAKRVGWQYHATIIWNEQNISRRTAWGSWMSASAPFVIAPVEMIVVLYKERWKKDSKGTSDISRDEFMEWTNAVWTFNGENGKRIGHPAPYPIELPRRCIKLFSYVDDLVLDPFLGSGTTLVACAQTGRRGIGFDIDPHYCALAKKRILAETNTQAKPAPQDTPAVEPEPAATISADRNAVRDRMRSAPA